MTDVDPPRAVDHILERSLATESDLDITSLRKERMTLALPTVIDSISKGFVKDFPRNIWVIGKMGRYSGNVPLYFVEAVCDEVAKGKSGASKEIVINARVRRRSTSRRKLCGERSS